MKRNNKKLQKKVTFVAIGAFLIAILLFGGLLFLMLRVKTGPVVDRSCDLGARGTDVQHSTDPSMRVEDAVSSYHLMNRCYGDGHVQFLRNLSIDYKKQFIFEKDGENMVMCSHGNIADYRVIQETVSPPVAGETYQTVTRTYYFADGAKSKVEYTTGLENGDAKITSIKCV